MKPSRYNFVYPYQFNRDYSVVYNSLMDTVGIVTMREAEFIRSCDRGLGIHYTKITDFEKKGFIVDDNVSELSKLKAEYLRAKFDSKLLSVVIVPTYQCNLNCTYCYEKLTYGAEDNTVMSEQVQDRICRWAEKNLDGVETFEVFWHGGEPLIALDTVKRLSGMLKRLAENRGIRYTAQMSTNGYLFTESVAAELKELGITKYKMSMDGCGANHDSRKRHKDGTATYEIILGNIEKSIGLIDEIDLRINVNKEDIGDAYEIMQILKEKGLSGKVIPRLGKPMKYAEEVNDLTFTKEEFACEAVRYSLIQGVGPKDFMKKDCFCLMHLANSIIIDGHGTLFKCVCDTGDGQNCGKLNSDGSMDQNKNFYASSIYNPFDSEDCAKCPYLPVCFGECSFDRRENRPCLFGSLTDDCWAKCINAYVVKRLLNRLNTSGFTSAGGQSFSMDDLIMGQYEEKAAKFISNAASTYLLGDLRALAEKNSLSLSDEDAKLLLQLIQPTELAE